MKGEVSLAIKDIISKIEGGIPFNCYGAAYIDLQSKEIDAYQVFNDNEVEFDENIYFDLASITKPLSLGLTKLYHPELFNNEASLLLNHRAGLPFWARLSYKNWKNQLERFDIKESETVYSDLSALRCMLEVEKKSPLSLQKLAQEHWPPGVKHWSELTEDDLCPITGLRSARPIHRVVHDDNAFVLKEYCSHAGLFSTLKGICLGLQKWFDDGLFNQLIPELKKKHSRFVGGWDTPAQENSLAGLGFSPLTFGHLGFVGNSIWIDLEKKKAKVLLSNSTIAHFYHKPELQILRREFGSWVWKQ